MWRSEAGRGHLHFGKFSNWHQSGTNVALNYVEGLHVPRDLTKCQDAQMHSALPVANEKG